MAHPKPLSLKRQKSAFAGARVLQVKAGQLQAEVVIDTGVFHLEQEFSYLVPEDLAQRIQVGSIVVVPFKSDLKIGVVSQLSSAVKANLMNINRIVVDYGLTKNHLEFARTVANRYATTFPQILQLMLSGVNLRWNGKSTINAAVGARQREARREFVEITNWQQLNQEIESRLAVNNVGSRLLLFPTIKMLRGFMSEIEANSKAEVIEFGAHLSAAARKTAWLQIINGSNLVVVGLRGAIFAPIKDLAQILVVDEFSQSYFEQRRPYWNLRDVALLRGESERCDLIFLGSSCSLELWRLIDKGWITYRSAKTGGIKGPRKVVSAPQSYHSTIRQGLSSGPVLVCVSEKDYASGFVCAQCRNRARCKCGGYLYLTEKENCACSICDFQSSEWRCSECAASKTLVYRSGAKKLLAELGKAFPNEKILINTADKQLAEDISGRYIVVSTYGLEPISHEGYSAVVLLDGEYLTSRRFVRAEEETFHSWLRAVSLLRERGTVFASLMEKHPITQSIIARRNSVFLNSATRDRTEVHIPPSSRIIRLRGEAREVSGLRRKINAEFKNVVEIHSSLSGTEITMKVEHESAVQLLSALKALQKMRSASNKELFELKVDPFSF